MAAGKLDWKAALKDAAIELARKAERYVGAQDASLCASCEHKRSDHCGCGAHCISAGACACKGFTPKLEEPS